MFLTETTTHSFESTRLASQRHCLASAYCVSLFYNLFRGFFYDPNHSILFIFSELCVFLFHFPSRICEFLTSIGRGIHSVHAHGVGEALFVRHLWNVVITRVGLCDLGRLRDVYR